MLRSAEEWTNKKMQRNLNRTRVIEHFFTTLHHQVVWKHVPDHGKSNHPGHRPHNGNLRTGDSDAASLFQPKVSEKRPKLVQRPRRVRKGGRNEGLGDFAAATSNDKDERSAAQIRDKT